MAQVLNTVGEAEAGMADSGWVCFILAPWDVGGRGSRDLAAYRLGQPAFADCPTAHSPYSKVCFLSQATEPRIKSLIHLRKNHFLPHPNTHCYWEVLAAQDHGPPRLNLCCLMTSFLSVRPTVTVASTFPSLLICMRVRAHPRTGILP